MAQLIRRWTSDALSTDGNDIVIEHYVGQPYAVIFQDDSELDSWACNASAGPSEAEVLYILDLAERAYFARLDEAKADYADRRREAELDEAWADGPDEDELYEQIELGGEG